MNVTEKIFALHDVSRKGWVRPGEAILVSVDWVLSSDASWHNMLKVYQKMGDPGIFRNDRFWLAGDHVVDPRLRDKPLVRELVDEMDMARKKFKLTQFQGSNYTIMHTEFHRERAQPGQLVIGSDSHTCSAGADGCLAIGLGAAEVTMALVTGEIWFKVPEVVEIRLVSKPRRGIGGKDIILHILKELKRNTVASSRIVEYTGPGCASLSADARFAIANMTTEFGGITGIFAPDGITEQFIQSRKTARHKSDSVFFKADPGCSYAASHTIDLSQVETTIARYPSPDDVVYISNMAGSKLDGVFIGACTTAEEDLVLGALVLRAGLEKGWKPVAHGQRRVVPGSRPIADFLRQSGLAEVYEKAGFTIGIPGCSYCVGMGADMAAPGEVWLSSQNRNFENRMGRGAIGHLASAAAVAASSFSMTITSPQELVNSIPDHLWDQVKGRGSLGDQVPPEPHWVEPPSDAGESTGEELLAGDVHEEPTGATSETSINSKIYRLGDFVDTDALAPAQFALSSKDEGELGQHCLEFTNPEFRQLVREGHRVVVAGKAFGCGSSRQEAVQALLGIGVQCVIAESFAFIYNRNQPSLGLWGFTMTDPRFYAKAQTGESIDIDLELNELTIGGERFKFELTDIEKALTRRGGIIKAFNQYGTKVYNVITKDKGATTKKVQKAEVQQAGASDGSALEQWIVALKPEVSSDSDFDLHARWVSELHAINVKKRDDAPTGLEKTFKFPGFSGYVGSFGDDTLNAIKNNPNVTAVERNQEVFLASPVTQENPPWGLSAISHSNPPSSSSNYKYDSSAGTGTFSYVLDSGLLASHKEFEGRATLGYDATNGAETDHGHGTHVAGIIGGSTYGVAKKTSIVGVQVTGIASGSSAWLLDGLDWTIRDILSKKRVGKAVINMSLLTSSSTITNNAVQAVIDSGVPVVAAAGNSNIDAADWSPANLPEAITVAASNKDYQRWRNSNWGSVVDLFAPGQDVTSAWVTSSTATYTTSGTSQAAPHVAGVVAYLLALEGPRTPAEIKARILDLAIKDLISDRREVPNLLLYNGNGA
ncbi:hypothetical protein ACHAPT_010258 [Fusarium lateritium]